MNKAGRLLKELYTSIQVALEGEYETPCPPCQMCEHIMCMAPDMDNHVCCCVAINAATPTVALDGRSGPQKDYGDITDVQSTGRKRCAVMYPIEDGMICEWANLKHAGGGVTNIFGCLGNPATNRHHGPDKNTLNNTEGNVHRICSSCHNYWHGQNDRFYGDRPSGTEPFIPLGASQWTIHDKETSATVQEIILDQVRRKT